MCPTKNTDYNSEAYIKALSSVKKSDLHSDAYYNALKDGVIKLIDENTENEYWDFTVFSSVYTAFINKEGLYAIGDTLYQVTNNSVKMIKYTDPKSKNELLNSKENNNILYKSPIQKVTSPEVLTSGWVQEPTGPWYPKRIKIDVELSLQYLIVSTLHYEFFHRVHMECQGRNFFRKWIYDDPGNVIINGSWEISVYRFPQLYSDSFYFSGFANNYLFSVNPDTGEINNYNSYYIVHPNSGNFEYGYSWPERQLAYQPYFTHCNWTATRTDKNLTATIEL